MSHPTRDTASAAVPLRSQPLSDWLAWLETIHPVAIDMGLERVSAVADRLGLRPAKAPLILVGGTNGKGSTVAMLSAIYQAAGYKVGAYTSPHITHFCERIRVNDVMADEDAVVAALEFIEQGRAPQTLTYFEYTTLAAMRVFDTLQCDVLLFEVGLGGRLDATNIWDADCSIITSIGLDHEAYLGSDLSVIATEKAAIGRPGRPFVSGEHMPPASLAQYALEHNFQYVDMGSMPETDLPHTNMSGVYQRRNAGCAVAAVDSMQASLPVPKGTIDHALLNIQVDGRFERMLVDEVTVVLDVAHNPAGAAALVQAWVEQYGSMKCDIVFASLADKDISGVVCALGSIVDTWHCLALDAPRAATSRELVNFVKQSDATSHAMEYANTRRAVQSALVNAKAGARPVLVAGSFYTIAAAKSVFECGLTLLD